MSYSRFQNSNWYTFWNTSSGAEKNDQVFTVFGLENFTYLELSTDLDGCIAKVNGDGELKNYMKDFMRDVDAEFTV